jgi:hypothetical protein
VRGMSRGGGRLLDVDLYDNLEHLELGLLHLLDVKDEKDEGVNLFDICVVHTPHKHIEHHSDELLTKILHDD